MNDSLLSASLSAPLPYLIKLYGKFPQLQETIAKQLAGPPLCPEALESAAVFHSLRTLLHQAGALNELRRKKRTYHVGAIYQLTPKELKGLESRLRGNDGGRAIYQLTSKKMKC